MRKIPTLFERNFETWLAYDKVTKGCDWVTKGEGVATRKYDGTACLVKNGILFKRYDCKKDRPLPKFGSPCQSEPDPETGHWPWWIPLSKYDKWHMAAFVGDEPNGTYELCGPKINGNPEGFGVHNLVCHDSEECVDCPRAFEAIKEYLKDKDIEGIVWHRENGDMCKIKKKDFGMKRRN